jgi:hypothetical protein
MKDLKSVVCKRQLLCTNFQSYCKDCLVIGSSYTLKMESIFIDYVARKLIVSYFFSEAESIARNGYY